MSYQSVHNTNVRFKLAIMWILIAAFVIAVPLMFVHPLAVLALFFSGLIVLAIGAGVATLMRRAERFEARRELTRHDCPGCGAVIDLDPTGKEEWRCNECGAVFLDSGELKA